MQNITKIPVTIITGFLGSGKTTLISQLMQNPLGKRLAVIVNEFGDVGVDGQILKGCAIPNCPEENIMELANGCICCTVADDFIPTIEALMSLSAQPEHILIETSGLALPKPLLKAFDWPDIRSRITVDGVIALADAEAVASGQFAPNLAGVEAQREADNALDHETPLSEVFEDQVACADLILLTKADLANEADKAKAKQIIANNTPRQLPIIEVVEGQIDPRLILGLEAAAENDIEQRPSHHDGAPEHDHDDFDSAIFNIAEFDSPETLVQKIEILAREHHILRVKGYAAISGKPMRLLVQAVGSRVRSQFDKMWQPDEVRNGQLVVIAEHDHINVPAINKILKG
ncbi:MAG: cobalamin biosynthesis protein CobW [Alphaproteobacteria bacterium]|nr:cobalamin biosynthesis protein CobW [Alphaproteobacteria bacterium]